jgi:hypothetical protein
VEEDEAVGGLLGVEVDGLLLHAADGRLLLRRLVHEHVTDGSRRKRAPASDSEMTTSSWIAITSSSLLRM